MASVCGRVGYRLDVEARILQDQCACVLVRERNRKRNGDVDRESERRVNHRFSLEKRILQDLVLRPAPRRTLQRSYIQEEN